MELTLIVVTVISIAFAAIMAVIAWRLVQAERRRSDARVAALSADLQHADLELRPSRVAVPSEMFRLEGTGRESPRLTTVVAVGVFAVATAVAVIVATGRSGEPLAARTATDAASLPSPSAERERVPLELVALGHDRDGDRITVRGVIRNPSAGVGLDHLSVVVFLFNREGAFLGSGTAQLQAQALGPGVESAFVITVPNATDVGRYRVSFRSHDQIVPHVDRRDPVPVAQVK